jgi:predicted ATP-grasp superfamily ATP-dependent carboligase
MANEKPGEAARAAAARPGRRPLAILGASARAAAFSALRAAFAPHACDRFGDLDLRAAAGWVEPAPPPGGSWVDGLAAALARLPDGPWLYTGGLDNSPRLIGELARLRPLWGNGAGVVRRVRDPRALAAALEAAGVPMPEIARPGRAAAGGGWIKKRLPDSREHYTQRLVPGLPASALYASLPAGCVFLGATRQLVGERWLGAPPFAWCGNIGPLPLAPACEERLRAAGAALATAFGLRGLFGLDFLLRPELAPEERDAITALEVNPRYTGAVEVLEHALGITALSLHASAFDLRAEPVAGGAAASAAAKRGTLAAPPAPAAHARPGAGELFGKAVVRAPRRLVTRADLRALYEPDPHAWPRAADLPLPGAPVEKGSPLLTVFARGPTETACRARLLDGARAALAHFEPSGRGGPR